MCLCCSTKAKTIKRDILPGYNLLKSMVDHPEWPLGYYGLQQCDDPDFIWKQKVECQPKPKKSFNTDKTAYEKWFKWAKDTDEMEKAFVCGPQTGYGIYKACLKAGYRPKRDGYRFVYWLRDHLAKKLKRE